MKDKLCTAFWVPCRAIHTIRCSVFIFLVLRRRRRGSVTTRKPHQCWRVYDYERPLKQFNDTFHTHAKNTINSSKFLSLKFLQKEARASFRPSETVHRPNEARLKRQESIIPKKKQQVFTRRQKKFEKGGYQQARPVLQDLPRFLFTYCFLSPQTLSSAVRGRPR